MVVKLGENLGRDLPPTIISHLREYEFTRQKGTHVPLSPSPASKTGENKEERKGPGGFPFF
jgi:hypothetical protein